MNIITVGGHLGADPEERFTPDGKRVITLRLATKTRKHGKDDVIWYKLAIWGNEFDKMLPFLKKGSAVIAVGEFQKPETYVTKEGQSRISLGIVVHSLMFPPFGKKEEAPFSETYVKPSESLKPSQSLFGLTHESTEISDDDIPF